MLEAAKVIRSNRRTVGLEITPTAQLIVRAPRRASLSYIEQVVRNHYAWIIRKQELARKRYQTAQSKQFITGETFLYLGNSFPLNLTQDGNKLHFEQAFYLPQHCLADAKQHFIAWYKAKALVVFMERVILYAKSPQYNYRKIRINDARKQWGSCSHNGNLNFCWRLIMAPLSVIDYVIAHELAHLTHHNHSQRFWNEVQSLFPEYEIYKKWLKKNGHLLVI